MFHSLMDATEEMDKYLKGKKSPGMTVKTVSVVPISEYSATKVKRLRKKSGLSQAGFADLLGVSDKTVQAWEQGLNTPNGSAIRLMDLLDKNPEAVMSRFLRRA